MGRQGEGPLAEWACSGIRVTKAALGVDAPPMPLLPCVILVLGCEVRGAQGMACATRLRGGLPPTRCCGRHAQRPRGPFTPLATREDTRCWGSNMEACWTSCHFPVSLSSEPGPF